MPMQCRRSDAGLTGNLLQRTVYAVAQEHFRRSADHTITAALSIGTEAARHCLKDSFGKRVRHSLDEHQPSLARMRGVPCWTR